MSTPTDELERDLLAAFGEEAAELDNRAREASTLVRPLPVLREGEFALKAEPNGLYGRTTRNFSRRRLHYVLVAYAIWRRPADGPAEFERFAILTDCGDWLVSAELHVRPTTDPACDYCEFAISRYQKSKQTRAVDF